MTYKKHKWSAYDPAKSEEQNILDGGVITAERIDTMDTELETQSKSIDRIIKGYDYDTQPASYRKGDVWFVKSNDVINWTEDLKNKVAGSDVNNPHSASAQYKSGALPLPPNSGSPSSNGWYELNQEGYTALSALDGVTLNRSTNNNSYNTPFVAITYDVLESFRRKAPSEFAGMTEAEQVDKVKSILRNLSTNIFGKGSSPNYNRLIFSVWNFHANAYGMGQIITGSTIQKGTISLNTNAISERISNDGKINFLAYADPSNGDKGSTLNLDYTSFDLASINPYAGKLIIATKDSDTFDLADWEPYTDGYTLNQAKEHSLNKDNPHQVTAGQVGAYSKTESQQMMLDFLAGKDIEITRTYDFKGKVPGSTAENPNVARQSPGQTFLPPLTTGEFGVNGYGKIELQNNDPLVLSTLSDGASMQIQLEYAVLESAKRDFPGIFEGLNEVERDKKLRGIVSILAPSVWAKGSGPAGKKLTVSLWRKTLNQWVTVANRNDAEIAKIEIKMTDFGWALGNDGFLNLALNTEASNGTTPSAVSVDYASLVVTYKLNIKDFMATKSDIEALKRAIIVLGGTV